MSSTLSHSSSQYPPGSYGIPSLLQLPPFYGAAITAWSPHMPVPSDIPPMGAGQLEQLAKCGVVIARYYQLNLAHGLLVGVIPRYPHFILYMNS